MLGESFPNILAAARTGAEWAWTSIYRDLAPSVLGYARARGAAEPEDVTGEVFLHLVRDLHRFDGGERDFRAWVFVVAHHRLIDEGRRRARRPVDPVAETPVGTDPGVPAEEEALDSIAADRIRRSLGQLPADRRDVLLLRVIGGLTVAEVAQVVGKSQGAVKALQRRGLVAVRRALAEEGGTS